MTSFLSTTSTTRDNAMTTALGDDGYESFVSKGSCRKCGCVAYGKRKCDRCDRKFCGTCAPRSLQTSEKVDSSSSSSWGGAQEDECCISCEPSRFVVTVSAGKTTTSDKKRNTNGYQDDPQERFLSVCSIISNTSETELSLASRYSDHRPEKLRHQQLNHHQEKLRHRQLHEHGETDTTRQTPPTTPTISSATHLACDLASSLSLVPLPSILRAPDAGCCTACQQYATGKVPCNRCGAKYCHGSYQNPDRSVNDNRPCLSLLDEIDGTCAKCQRQQEHDGGSFPPFMSRAGARAIALGVERPGSIIGSSRTTTA